MATQHQPMEVDHPPTSVSISSGNGKRSNKRAVTEARDDVRDVADVVRGGHRAKVGGGEPARQWGGDPEFVELMARCSVRQARFDALKEETARKRRAFKEELRKSTGFTSCSSRYPRLLDASSQ
ncbi:hypothetical protein ACP4OV_004733 [Aristida adscensionis]